MKTLLLFSCQVVSHSLWPLDCSSPGSSVHGISQARILEWVTIFFLQRIFLAQVSNPRLLHWQADFLPLSHQGSPCEDLQTSLKKKKRLLTCLSKPTVKERSISEHRIVFFVARLCLSQPHGFMPMPLIEKKGLKRNAADFGFSSVFGHNLLFCFQPSESALHYFWHPCLNDDVVTNVISVTASETWRRHVIKGVINMSILSLKSSFRGEMYSVWKGSYPQWRL